METRATQLPAGASGDLGQYCRSISPLGRITGDDEVRLARAWRESGRREARERLITANLRLVIALARRFAGRGVPLEELVAEGNVGLIHAVDRFDPTAGCRFSTYAAYWIRHSIGEAFARASNRTKLNRHDRLEIKVLERAADAFIAKNGHAATRGELAGVLEWGPERVREAQQLSSLRVQTRPLSDDSPLALEMIDTHKVDGPAERGGSDREVASQMKALLAALAPVERRAVELRFGLDSGRPCSLGAIATILELAPREANRVLRTAMTKLARMSRAGVGRTEAKARNTAA